MVSVSVADNLLAGAERCHERPLGRAVGPREADWRPKGVACISRPAPHGWPDALRALPCESSNHLRQIRTPRVTLVADAGALFARAVGGERVEPGAVGASRRAPAPSA